MKYTAPEMEMKALDLGDIIMDSPVGGNGGNDVVGPDGDINTPDEEL